nr:MAG: ORF1 [Torque teno virus]
MWWRRPWRWRPKRRWRWRRRRRRPRYRRRRRAARTTRRPRVRKFRFRFARPRRYRLRRRRRRRKRQKINIKQWNPAVTKMCHIVGYYPLIICGEGTTAYNFTSHADDYVMENTYGGGMCTTIFSLSVLYDQFQRHRNFWTKSNIDLDLVRYKRAKFTIYRHPEVDFILHWNRNPPFTETVISAPMLHPAILMNSKRKIVVPSLLTKPRGRKKFSFKVGPPRLFTDHWYFQADFYKLPLLTLSATACCLRFPFCSPQTNNICISFQTLASIYNDKISIVETSLATNYENLINAIKTGLKKHQAFNTFKTQEHLRCPSAEACKRPLGQDTNCYKHVNSLWGDSVYYTDSSQTGYTAEKDVYSAFKSNCDKLYEARSAHTLTGSKYLNWKTGMYSGIFLCNERLSPDYPGIYNEVVYNPLMDKGEGNKVWIQWCSKPTTEFIDNQCYCVLEHVPLYAAFFGYIDFCSKNFKDANLYKNVRIVLITPYTKPMLFNKDKPNWGYVPYDYYFGQSKMPDGTSYIPEYYRFRWYANMFHQQNFIKSIVECGPFAYRGEHKSTTLTTKYRFDFLWGGNPIYQQTVKDPSKQPTFEVPGAGGIPRPIQIINPKHIDPSITFHRWDLRRGFFGPSAIKRMQKESTDALLPPTGAKRPRTEVPVAEPDAAFSSRERKHRAWEESSSEETESEAEAQEETKTIQEQLQQQLSEQRRIRCGLQHMFQQLAKTQLHLNVPPIL